MDKKFTPEELEKMETDMIARLDQCCVDGTATKIGNGYDLTARGLVELTKLTEKFYLLIAKDPRIKFTDPVESRMALVDSLMTAYGHRMAVFLVLKRLNDEDMQREAKMFADSLSALAAWEDDDSSKQVH